MSTFLLTWNPGRWGWKDPSDNLRDSIREVRRRGYVERRWSCGNSGLPQQGDRVFLMRQGIEPRGIIGAGTVIDGSYWGPHWEKQKAQAGKRGRFVKVRFDTLLDPEHDVILAREVLIGDARFEGGNWDCRMSGTQIEEPTASELENAWVRLTDVGEISGPEEIPDEETLYEGAKRRVWVNAYERSQVARRRCVAHYGMACVICDFNFLDAYGDAGESFVHVHHLTPLSEIGEGYEVDPIRDLRPVCANCHAIIHRCQPPYTIKEVKGFLEQARRRKLAANTT